MNFNEMAVKHSTGQTNLIVRHTNQSAGHTKSQVAATNQPVHIIASPQLWDTATPDGTKIDARLTYCKQVLCKLPLLRSIAHNFRGPALPSYIGWQSTTLTGTVNEPPNHTSPSQDTARMAVQRLGT